MGEHSPHHRAREQRQHCADVGAFGGGQAARLGAVAARDEEGVAVGQGRDVEEGDEGRDREEGVGEVVWGGEEGWGEVDG